MKYWLSIAALVLLGGCASLTKEECVNADWFLIGFEDGSAGMALGAVGRHRKACAKANITPDFNDYERGHDKGIARYCTAESGFRIGNNGGSYNSVCTGVREDEFLTAFRAGHERFNKRKQVNELEARLDHYAKREVDIKHELIHYSAEIISADSTLEDRVHHVQVIKNLHEEKSALKENVPATAYDLEIVQEEFDALLRKQHAQGYP